MEMTDEEIFRDWKLSNNKKKQVSILAELNGCTTKEIYEAIQRYGEDKEEIEKMLEKVRRKPKAEKPKEEIKIEDPVRADDESVENGSSLPKSVQVALERRIEILEVTIKVKQSEIDNARSDIQEIKQFMMGK